MSRPHESRGMRTDLIYHPDLIFPMLPAAPGRNVVPRHSPPPRCRELGAIFEAWAISITDEPFNFVP